MNLTLYTNLTNYKQLFLHRIYFGENTVSQNNENTTIIDFEFFSQNSPNCSKNTYNCFNFRQNFTYNYFNFCTKNEKHRKKKTTTE